jgi:hypothetical protein
MSPKPNETAVSTISTASSTAMLSMHLNGVADVHLRVGRVGTQLARLARMAECVGVAALVHEGLDHVLARIGEGRIEFERLDPLLYASL